MTICGAVLLCAASMAGLAQSVEPMGLKNKLKFHVQSVGNPVSLSESAAYVGILQALRRPREWGHGAGAYSERLASAFGSSAIHGALAFGLDSTLRQDPRYFRSLRAGFWNRAAHAFRGTILTRTDSGGETLSTWRLGSDYGAAFLSSQWYPERLNTARLGAMQGSFHLGFDLVTNLGVEFWPDLKRKVLRRK